MIIDLDAVASLMKHHLKAHGVLGWIFGTGMLIDEASRSSGAYGFPSDIIAVDIAPVARNDGLVF